MSFAALALVSVMLTPPAMADAFKVALVMPGNITDQSWNQAGYEGLMNAKKELGIEVAFSEKVAQPDQAEAMADYARRGYNVVIGHGGEFQEAANRVARKHPDTLFVVHNGTEPAKNIATLDFYYKQFGYLLGVIAGRMSKSGKVGFIGAQKI
ncbi:MAG: BMP family ABC transporter substrate-binding protein, partial [Hyphomicrobium sp.]